MNHHLKSFLVPLCALALSSCSLVSEDLPECRYFVQLSYTRNILDSEAAGKVVNSLHLGAFDAGGTLVWDSTYDRSQLEDLGYKVPVNVGPGNYTIQAWCGIDGADWAFTETDLSALPNRSVTIASLEEKDGIAVSERNLGNLLHGLADVEFPAAAYSEDQTVAVLPLTKDNNRICVLLEQIEGVELDPDNFDIRFESANAKMLYDNKVTGPTVTYNNWYKESVVLSEEEEATRATKGRVIKAEFSLSRITADNPVRMVVHRLSDNRDIIDINVNSYLALSKPEGSEWSDDEYLNREDNYVMHLFLDRDLNWFTNRIYINNWRGVATQVVPL